MITKEYAQGNWKAIVGAVKEKFGQITGDELTGLEGSLDRLIGLVQRKTGESREWVEAFLTDASGASKDMAQKASGTATEYANHAAEVIRDNYEHLTDAAHRGYEQISDVASRGYDNTVKTVSKRPLESIAIALGCGVLAGLVIGLSLASKRRSV